LPINSSPETFVVFRNKALKNGVSYAVNPVILKFMENLRYIDKLGRGIPMVCLEAKKLGHTPWFEETGEEFQVTLPFI